MPRTGDYSFGKIYKSDYVYIGSTSQRLLSKILTEHEAYYKKWKEGIAKKKMSKFEITQYGDCMIV